MGRVRSGVVVALSLALLVALGCSCADAVREREFKFEEGLRKRMRSTPEFRRQAGEGDKPPKVEEFLNRLKMEMGRNPEMGGQDLASLMFGGDRVDTRRHMRPGRGLRSHGAGARDATMEFLESGDNEDGFAEVSFVHGFRDEQVEAGQYDDEDLDIDEHVADPEEDGDAKDDEGDDDNEIVVTVNEGSKYWQFRRSGSAGRNKFVKEVTKCMTECARKVAPKQAELAACGKKCVTDHHSTDSGVKEDVKEQDGPEQPKPVINLL